MKTLKELPLHIQVKMLANQHKLTDKQQEEWFELVKAAYIKGSNDAIKPY